MKKEIVIVLGSCLILGAVISKATNPQPTIVVAPVQVVDQQGHKILDISTNGLFYYTPDGTTVASLQPFGPNNGLVLWTESNDDFSRFHRDGSVDVPSLLGQGWIQSYSGYYDADGNKVISHQSDQIIPFADGTNNTEIINTLVDLVTSQHHLAKAAP